MPSLEMVRDLGPGGAKPRNNGDCGAGGLAEGTEANLTTDRRKLATRALGRLSILRDASSEATPHNGTVRIAGGTAGSQTISTGSRAGAPQPAPNSHIGYLPRWAKQCAGISVRVNPTEPNWIQNISIRQMELHDVHAEDWYPLTWIEPMVLHKNWMVPTAIEEGGASPASL